MFYLFKSIGRFRRKTICYCHRFCSTNIDFKSVYKPKLPPWNVIFYGTDLLSEVTLKALNSNRMMKNEFKVVQNLEVVCIKVFNIFDVFYNARKSVCIGIFLSYAEAELTSDSPVRRYATLNALTIHTWPFDIPLGVYDVGIVVSFGHMIPASSIEACKYGIINAHPSLLPRWRGAAPIFHTILNGDEKTGVTITQVSPNKFDVGNILMQEEYLVPECYTTKLLMEDLSKLAADMVLKTLRKLPYYIETSYPQPTEGRTLARKIKPKNCNINWAEDSSVCIDRKFRAFKDFFDLYTTWRGCLKIDILDMVSLQEVKDAKIHLLVKNPVSPGFCIYHKKRKLLYVRCQDDWIGIRSVRIPHTGRITALDFYNGFITKVGLEEQYFV